MKSALKLRVAITGDTVKRKFRIHKLVIALYVAVKPLIILKRANLKFEIICLTFLSKF